jgi:hypothetical protein
VECADFHALPRSCPACGTSLEANDVQLQRLILSDSERSLIGAGWSPELAAEVLTRSLKFWEYQQDQHALLNQRTADHSATAQKERLRELETQLLDMARVLEDTQQQVSTLEDELNRERVRTSSLEVTVLERSRRLSQLSTGK